jgi:hypothetical protein
MCGGGSGGGSDNNNNERILPSALLVSTCNRWLSTDITGALSSTTSFSLICEHKSVGSSSNADTTFCSYKLLFKPLPALPEPKSAFMSSKLPDIGSYPESTETSHDLHTSFIH